MTRTKGQKHIHTFSLMSMSQESMLSRKRSSVLPLLLLRLLLWSSCLFKHTEIHKLKEEDQPRIDPGDVQLALCWDYATADDTGL